MSFIQKIASHLQKIRQLLWIIKPAPTSSTTRSKFSLLRLSNYDAYLSDPVCIQTQGTSSEASRVTTIPPTAPKHTAYRI
jgi:hypothetical protein